VAVADHYINHNITVCSVTAFKLKVKGAYCINTKTAVNNYIAN